MEYYIQRLALRHWNTPHQMYKFYLTEFEDFGSNYSLIIEEEE